jgi:hypothetical protein
MEMYGGVEIKLHSFSTSDVVEWVSFKPSGNSKQNTLDRRLGEPQYRSGRGGEGNNPYFCWDPNPGCPDRSQYFMNEPTHARMTRFKKSGAMIEYKDSKNLR